MTTNRTLVPLMSVPGLAAHLGVPIQTVRRWRVHGLGPRGIRVGKYVRFDPADVAAWQESQKDPAA